MSNVDGDKATTRRRDLVLSDRMTVVLGYAELVLEENFGPLTPEQRRALFNVVVAAREMRDLLRNSAPPL
jgi:hypothetical protein